MAGVETPTQTALSVGLPEPLASAQTASAPSVPSLPLYLAGAVITLCGILAANAALPQPDYGWMTDTLMLAALGFLFSYGSRQLGIAARTLDFGFAAALALLLLFFGSGQLSFVQFLPVGADNMNLRLLTELVWGGTVWAWALRSDTRVMLATIPAMAVLGMAATIDVNNPVLICFGVFILTVIFLLIHQNYLQNRQRAAVDLSKIQLSRLDDEQRRLLPAQFVQAGFCGLVVLLIGLVVVIPAQVVFSHLSLAQAIRRLAALPNSHTQAGAALRFSDDDSMQIGTGDAWSSSPDVVMRVTPSDGQPHYWRGRTYDLYTGGGWQSSLENKYQDVTEGSPADSDRLSYAVPSDLTPGDLGHASETVPEFSTTFEVRGETNQFYYAAAPRQIVFDAAAAEGRLGTRLGQDGRMGLADDGSIHFPYEVDAQSMPDLDQPETAARLRQAGRSYPADVRRLYLRLSHSEQPEDLVFYRRSIGDATGSLPANRHDPLDEALALRDWVSQQCVYTLTPPPIPDNVDHVHYFLGTSKQGYCDMFASSLTVLCRTAGIPARLVTGFAPGEADGSSFNLRAEDKHAWTEVYFPGVGWVTFDATSGSSTDGTVPTAQTQTHGSWLSRLKQQLGAGGGFVFPLLAIVAAIVGYVLKTEVFDRRRIRQHTSWVAAPDTILRDAGLSQAYTRLSRSLTRVGLPRRTSETPDEYAARILPGLPNLERDAGVTLSSSLVTEITAAVTQALYASPAAVSIASPSWDPAIREFESASRRVQWHHFWSRKYSGVSVSKLRRD